MARLVYSVDHENVCIVALVLDARSVVSYQPKTAFTCRKHPEQFLIEGAVLG